MERGPEFEARFIVARFLAGSGWGQRCGRRRGVGRQRLEVGLDGGVAGGELLLHVIERLHVLAQDKDVLRPIVARESCDDLGLGRVAPIVAVLREGLRVGSPSHDVPQDPQAGDAGDVAHDERQLDVHLHERFLHALHMRAGALHERGSVPEVRAERDHRVGGTKAPAQEPHHVQVTEPLANPRHRSFGLARS